MLSLDFVKLTPTSLTPPRFLVSVGVMFFMIEDVFSDKIACATCVTRILLYFYNDYFIAALGYGTPNLSFGAILKMLFALVSTNRQWHPPPVLLPGKSHGRRSLEGCSPWSR